MVKSSAIARTPQVAFDMEAKKKSLYEIPQNFKAKLQDFCKKCSEI